MRFKLLPLLFLVVVLNRCVAHNDLDAWVMTASTESVTAQPPAFLFFDATAATPRPVSNGERSYHQSMCSWNARDGECVPDDWYIFSLVEHSTSELGHLYAPFLEMTYEMDTVKETRAKTLIQTSYMDRIAEHLGHYASSPCFNDVSTLWQLTTKSSTCRNLKHKTDCFAEPSCTWLWKKKRCDLDSWYLLYNIKSQDAKCQIVLSYAQEYMTAFDAKFGELVMDDHRFDWNTVLEWNIDYSCPFKGQAPVCAYALGFTKIFPISMYCARKYPSFFQLHECHTDPLCQPTVNPGPMCGPSDHEVVRSKSEALSIFLDGIEDPFLRGMFTASAYCDAHGAQRVCDRCPDMACRWSRRDGACAVSQKWVGSKLRKSDVTDPLCFLFTIPDRSECLDINNYFSCVLRGDQCEWKTRTAVCEPRVHVYLRAIGQEDPEMMLKLHDAKAACRSRERKTCSALPTT